MITTILFDADGVLIIGERFVDHLTNDLHINSQVTEPFFKGKFKDCLVGKADLKEEIAPFLPRWGWTRSVDDFLTNWFKVEHHFNEELLSYIQKLRSKGIKCYVATNQEKYRSQYMKDYMKLKPLFDGFFASNEIGVCKPNIAFFQYIIDQLHIDKSQALFWDDTKGHVEAAAEFGLSAELYTTFEDCKTKTEHYLLT